MALCQRRARQARGDAAGAALCGALWRAARAATACFFSRYMRSAALQRICARSEERGAAADSARQQCAVMMLARRSGEARAQAL